MVQQGAASAKAAAAKPMTPLQSTFANPTPTPTHRISGRPTPKAFGAQALGSLFNRLV